MWNGTMWACLLFFDRLAARTGPTVWEIMLFDICGLSFSTLSAQTHFVIAANSFDVRHNSGES